ncbi:hypothetical protein AB1N83_006097 [Pleurotus pulmonarius]
MAAQVFDLSVTSLNRSEALTRLERKIDALTETVRWIVEVAAGERDLKMAWARLLERIVPGSEEDTGGADEGMEVDDAKAPSTSDTGDVDDAESADEEEDEEEKEERKGWKGKGKARGGTETSEEESSEEE